MGRRLKNADPWMSPPESVPGAAKTRRPWHIAAAGLIVLATVAAYANSLCGEFIFDDKLSIVDNTTIRQLWPLSTVLSPPHAGETVSGRPLLNFSLAVNYAIGGAEVFCYHVTNVVIHVLAALVLFGILRRTLLLPSLREQWADAATPLALTVALLWAVHPLQTESVTYIVQRAESLGALFYLLTLYCVIRGSQSLAAWVWYVGSVLACLAGMATKEVMVTAPLVVLLYDRTFLSSSLVNALQRRWALYLGLAAAWCLLAYLVYSTALVGHRDKLEIPGVWAYAGSQPEVILYYLRLCLWPHPLCLEYGWPMANTVQEVLPALLAVGSLGLLTLWGLIRRRVWAFLGASFFLILAPSSSLMPLGQLAFEHRLYLPLATVITLLAAAVFLALESLVARRVIGRSAANRFATALVVVACIGLATATYVRNQDYRTRISIWRDTVAKAQCSFIAWESLGAALQEEAVQGKDRPSEQAKCNAVLDEAVQCHETSLRLKPGNAMALFRLGSALARQKRLDEAIARYEESLRIWPRFEWAHNNLGVALELNGKLDAAIFHYREAVRLAPDFADAYENLGRALSDRGQTDDALDAYAKAVAINPQSAKGRCNFGSLLHDRGRLDEAVEQLQKAIDLQPTNVDARNVLAIALFELGRADDAVTQWKEAIKRAPHRPDLRSNLARALSETARSGVASDSREKNGDRGKKTSSPPLPSPGEP